MVIAKLPSVSRRRNCQKLISFPNTYTKLAGDIKRLRNPSKRMGIWGNPKLTLLDVMAIGLILIRAGLSWFNFKEFSRETIVVREPHCSERATINVGFAVNQASHLVDPG